MAELGEAGETDFLLLTDLTGAYLNMEAMDAFVKLGRSIDPYVKASAVVGMTGVRKRLVQLHNRLFSSQRTAFDTMDEAKDWLIDAAGK